MKVSCSSLSNWEVLDCCFLEIPKQCFQGNVAIYNHPCNDILNSLMASLGGNQPVSLEDRQLWPVGYVTRSSCRDFVA